MNARNATTLAVTLSVLVILAGCATSKGVNPKEPRTLIGSDNGVRLDAAIFADTLTFTQQIGVRYVVSNERSTPIAIAELIPESSYDSDSHVVTVSLGSEVPGQEMLPRLIEIGPGQKKTFSTAARITIPVSGGPTNPYVERPNGVQLKLSFLSDPQPFRQLIGIPERVVRDPKLADALFPKWLEKNESIFTNVLPMRWSAGGQDDAPRGAGDPRRP